MRLIHCRLIDGTGAAPAEDMTVIINGGTICEIRPFSDADLDGEYTDMSGLTVLPGLCDSHIHLGANYDFVRCSLLGSAATDNYSWAINGLLDAGVTLVRSAGDFEGDMLKLRSDIDSGAVAGPDIAVAGRAFQAPGGHPLIACYGNDSDVAENAVFCSNSPDECRAEVNRQADAGVDHIKAFLATDNFADFSKPFEHLHIEALRAIVEAAHQRGLKVMVHCQEPEFTELALRCGADSIEHVLQAGHQDKPFSCDVSELFLANGAVMVPTIVVAKAIGMPPAVISGIGKCVKELSDRGVKLAVGTDTGVPGVMPGAAVHDEMELLCEAGIDSMQVILAATRNGAELCGKLDRLGTLEVGKQADILAVEGDPLENISNIRNVKLVIKKGNIVKIC